jgi:riboflavin biosynthesis pyrimidine reductase
MVFASRQDAFLLCPAPVLPQHGNMDYYTVMSEIIRLYPAPHGQCRLKGLYLDEQLHRLSDGNGTFIYANFVSSLDGRIGLKRSGQISSSMPEGLSNSNDFRLFLELQAQADCLVTHGGYLRELADDRLGNVLQVGIQDEAGDLPGWRQAQGLKPQPDIIVASASLDFPLPEDALELGQNILIATGRQADPQRVRHWENQGIEVLFAGDRYVQGEALAQALETRGYRCVYLVTGPKMLETMVRDRCLARLYLTQRLRLFGGKEYHSMVSDGVLGEAGYLQLRSLYFDTSPLDGCTQLFASYQL